MERMKRFRLYLFMFLGFFVYVSIMTSICMKPSVDSIDKIEVLTESPIITILECKTEGSNGNIKGTITNNTGEHIQLLYLKAYLYNAKGTHIGTKEQEIKYLNVNEDLKFALDFEKKNVNSIKLSLEIQK